MFTPFSARTPPSVQPETNHKSSSITPRVKTRLVVRSGKVLLRSENRRAGGAKSDSVPVPVLSGRD